MNNQKNEIDTLLEELHAVPQQVKQATPFTLQDNNLKQFLLDKAGELIEGSVECVSNYKSLLGGNPDVKEAGALAELIKATSTAIESLNKLYIQDERSRSAREVEHIRAEVKNNANVNENGLTIKMSRKELMAQIFNKSKNSSEEIIDVQ